MKAARLYRYGEKLRLSDIDVPSAMNSGDVIIRTAAAGICRTDIHIIDGLMKESMNFPALPYTLGHENVGFVEEINGDVRGIKEGDPVILHPQNSCGFCRACRSGRDMLCDNGFSPGLDGTDGGFAEYIRTGSRSLVKLKQSTDLVGAAPLADAGVTVYHALNKVMHAIPPDGNIAVIGTGGLGQIAVQVLKCLTECNIIAVDADEKKIRIAERLGVKDTIHSAGKDFSGELLRFTANIGADVIFDFVGDFETPQSSIKGLRKGGVYSIIGYGGALNVPTVKLVGSEISVMGNLVGSYNDLDDIVKLYEKGKIRLNVDRFRLEEINEALEKLKSGLIDGRGVVVF